MSSPLDPFGLDLGGLLGNLGGLCTQATAATQAQQEAINAAMNAYRSDSPYWNYMHAGMVNVGNLGQTAQVQMYPQPSPGVKTVVREMRPLNGPRFGGIRFSESRYRSKFN